MHAIKIVPAATGGAGRAKPHPGLPLVVGALAGGQSAMAAEYLFYQMPCVDEGCCPYCIAAGAFRWAACC